MRETRHIPVLLLPVLATLNPVPGQVMADCTVGLGGHSRELLNRLSPNGKLIGLDMDQANLERARGTLAEAGGDFSLHHNNFAALPTILAAEGVGRVDGILADLGVASPQIDDPERGFSYRQPGPLDMRMDATRGQTAADLINRIPQAELTKALLDLGDEEDAQAIAELVVNRRQEAPIRTTQDLMSLVCQARHFTIQRAAGAKLHPAARTFQALRMMVNREIPNLLRLLAVLGDCLKCGGTVAIISFHSGEDRLVKRAFKEGLAMGIYSQISPEPIIATEAEEKANPRSRSAKLRWAKRSELGLEPSSTPP